MPNRPRSQRSPRSQRWQLGAVVVAVLLVVAVVALVRGGGSTTGTEPSARPGGPAATGAPSAGGPTDPASGLPWVAESSLNTQARQTLGAIRAGGPFPYPRNDGVVFENREGLLPQEKSGYYHEYTVPTPGSQDRGPRRIIAGSAGETYYTGDHYDSFQRIREGR